MPVFASAEKVYDCLRPVFDRITKETPNALAEFMKAKVILRLKLSAPAAEVWLNSRQKDLQIAFGPNTAQRPDLDVEIAGDNLHLILLDQLSTKKAMGEGKIKVKGPFNKLPVVIEVIKASRPFYAEAAQAQGIK